MLPRLRAATVAVLVGALLSTGAPAQAPAQAAAAPTAVAPVASVPAATADGADFDPGYIISDAVFDDSSSMTADQVQRFIATTLPGCAYTGPVACLRAYREDSIDRPASPGGQCDAYRGGTAELASTILSRVATACHVNPKVLLVLLQKEQGLVTQPAPTERDYRVATGYGCPDTSPCVAEFYGFSNQLYKAAWQLREYLIDPAHWRYRVGPVAVLFNPVLACSTSVIVIRNQATAALYNYTPYQPNDAALADLHGHGDACSSYGNRNFWVFFTEWFGSTTRR